MSEPSSPRQGQRFGQRFGRVQGAAGAWVRSRSPRTQTLAMRRSAAQFRLWPGSTRRTADKSNKAGFAPRGSSIQWRRGRSSSFEEGQLGCRGLSVRDNGRGLDRRGPAAADRGVASRVVGVISSPTRSVGGSSRRRARWFRWELQMLQDLLHDGGVRNHSQQREAAMTARTLQNVDPVNTLEQRCPVQIALTNGQQVLWGEWGTDQHRRHVEVIQGGGRCRGPLPRQRKAGADVVALQGTRIATRCAALLLRTWNRSTASCRAPGAEATASGWPRLERMLHSLVGHGQDLAGIKASALTSRRRRRPRPRPTTTAGASAGCSWTRRASSSWCRRA